MDELKKEIRKILTGFVYDDGVTLIAAPGIMNTSFNGIYTGAYSARIFGLTVRKRRYSLKMKTSEAREACRKALYELGRTVQLKNLPEADAVLSFPILHNPCVITVTTEANYASVTFYTARTPLAFLNAGRGFKRFAEHLPKNSFEEIGEKSVKKASPSKKK